MEFFIAGFMMGALSAAYLQFWLECKLLDAKLHSKLDELARVDDETK